MKENKIFIFLAAAVFVSSSNLTAPEIPGLDLTAAARSRMAVSPLGSSAVCFIENRGQFEEGVEFLARMPSGNILFSPREIVFQLAAAKETLQNFRMEFIGAATKPKLEALGQTPASFNYLYGNDPRRWVSGVPAYHKIRYHNLYSGIDLLVLGQNDRIKCEYRIRPGGRVEDIRIRYEGVETVGINPQHKLEIATQSGLILEDAPVSYQVVDGKRMDVKTAYVIDPAGDLRFKTDVYRRDSELVIDPQIAFSTLLGGTGQEAEGGIAVDLAGNIYVTGYTYSGNFPKTLGAYDRTFAGLPYDAFVTKLNPTGSGLVYSTFLGGNGKDAGLGISVDPSGQAIVCGYTESSNFPTTIGAFDRTRGGARDAFLTKLNAAGTKLVYSTLLGGSLSDEAAGLAVDKNGNACLSGTTLSPDFPTTVKAYDTTFSGGDAFLTKVNSSGTRLVFSTFFGGSGEEKGLGISLDPSGYIVITGTTTSANLPTTSGAYDKTLGGSQDIFVAKFGAAGGSPVFSTYLGSNGVDGTLGGLAVDNGKNVYLTGYTESNGYPTTSGAFDSAFSGSNEAFVTKLNSAGSALVYSTYLGGSNVEYGRGIGVDALGDAIVTGYTKSANWPITNDAFDRTANGDQDVFLTLLNPTGKGLLYSTYIGGSGADRTGGNLAQDAYGNAFIIGSTSSTNFPKTSGAYDRTYAGGRDDFIVKFYAPMAVLVVDGNDFNGNYACDAAVFRPTSGSWIIKNIGTAVWGAYGDIPANGDYDSDYSAEIAVWRPSEGTWYIDGTLPVKWGEPGDIPVPRNYFGDWATDIAVWRPADGVWYIKGSTNVLWGQAGDLPVPGDYNGNGWDEVAVWRPTTGTWLIKGIGNYLWGAAGDIPVPGDYNGDFKTDLAFWRPSTGTWYIKFLGGWTATVHWGQLGDVPVPADYNGDGITEPAVWRPASGTWSIYNGATFVWGQAGDIPVVR
jgi:Beta-propeller repeat